MKCVAQNVLMTKNSAIEMYNGGSNLLNIGEARELMVCYKETNKAANCSKFIPS